MASEQQPDEPRAKPGGTRCFVDWHGKERKEDVMDGPGLLRITTYVLASMEPFFLRYCCLLFLCY